MQEMLDHLADQILDLDPCELAELLPDIKTRMDECDNSREWERSVVSFFLINAVRFKHHLSEQAERQPVRSTNRRPHLRLVK
ncbi:MAG: hypothetical protein KQJ78_05110 [Deltaproteobacteria bacterium]|nr:hypothetical protein [Deltaproteobacteria bacterium]